MPPRPRRRRAAAAGAWRPPPRPRPAAPLEGSRPHPPSARRHRRAPPRQRAVVLLRCVEDLTIGEVTAALSITEGTVKSHVHHARSVLQAHLGPGDRDDRTGLDRRGPEPRTSPPRPSGKRTKTGGRP
nr:sigma factor-like helix-turn-helix DNA-binding protein [Kineococcus radiotolerans]